MREDFDKQQMLYTLTDPKVSEIMSELEDTGKDSSYLVKKLQITENEIRDRLSYVIEYGFVIMTQSENGTTFSVDKDKLDKIMESDENFDGVVSGLTELDQFLN